MNKPLSDYVIWGKAPGATDETLLISEHAGLRDLAHAESTAARLEQEHACTDTRIQRLKPLGDAREVAAMFGATIN